MTLAANDAAIIYITPCLRPHNYKAYFDIYSTQNFTNKSEDNVCSEKRKINILIKITLRTLLAWRGSNVLLWWAKHLKLFFRRSRQRSFTEFIRRICMLNRKSTSLMVYITSNRQHNPFPQIYWFNQEDEKLCHFCWDVKIIRYLRSSRVALLSYSIASHSS